MKNIKKLLSIVMVLTLVLALGAQAFAATVNITDAGDKVEHQYTAFQIFKGTQADGDEAEKLASIEWGDGIDKTGFLTELAAEYAGTFTADMSAEAAAKAMTAEGVDAEKVAKIAAKHTAGAGKVLTEGTNELDDGYYLIKDTTPAADLGGNAAFNDVMLQATGTIDVTWKSDVPSSEKKVQDDGEDDWQDSADWDIGDEVPFQITGTLPRNYGDYDTYYVAFHDKQEAGLNAPAKESFEVTVDGTKLTEGYEVIIPGTDGCTFDVVITDLKAAAPSAKAGSVIEVTYKSELNANAVVGRPGNPNTSHMEFSNNPNGEGHGNTPDDTVVVFTYQLNVEKVDGDKQPLDGAGFTLLKKVEGNTDTVTLGVAPNQVTYTGYVIVGEKDQMVEAKVVMEGEEEVTKYFVDFKGLDDGEYVLVESVVPDGYNKAEDLKFTVTATHDPADGTGDSLSNLVTDNEAITVSGVDDTTLSGQFDTQVMNNSGLELPETGGIGTTIFYVVGGILVAAAVILLVTKRRVSGAEK